MRVVFAISTCQQGLDGQSARDGGCAASGSHSSTVVAAEGVAEHLPRATVTFVGSGTGRRVRGVDYPEAASKEEGEAIELADVLVLPSWMVGSDVYRVIAKAKRLRHVVVWFHCHMLPWTHHLVRAGGPRWHFVHMSDWGERMSSYREHAAGIAGMISGRHKIPLGLLSDVFPGLDDVAGAARGRDLAFFAVRERGFDVARRVLDRLRAAGGGWGEIVAADYNDPSGRLDKAGVFSRLLRCRYFLYPLTLPSGIVHRDTFACVVAEALAVGVEVVTYPAGALPEIYGDMVHWLEFPPGVTAEQINGVQHDPAHCPAMLADGHADYICRVMRALDAGYESRAAARLANAEAARRIGAPAGAEWAALLSGMTDGA